MGVPPAESLARAGIRQPGKAPPRSERGAEGREACRDRSRGDQGRQLPHLPPLLCHPPAGAGPGDPNHPGAPRPQGRDDHHDLYPRSQSRPPRGPQPCGRSVSNRTVGSRTREPRQLGQQLRKTLCRAESLGPLPMLVVVGYRKGSRSTPWLTEPQNKELQVQESRTGTMHLH